MPAENSTASTASIQKSIPTASINHGPVLPGPYWEMLIRMVPKETTQAGTNKDSVGCRNDALKVYG